MHILFLTPAFPPFPGGGERYVESLARELTSRKHQVTIVTSAAQTERDLWQGTVKPQTHSELKDGLHIVSCPLRPFFGGRRGLLAWRKLMVLLSSLPGDQTAVLLKMSHLIPPIQNLNETLANLSDTFDIVHAFNISWEHTLMVGWQFAQRRSLPFVATPFTHFGVKGEDRVARNSTMDHQLNMLNAADRILTLTQIEKDGLIAWGCTSYKIDIIWGAIDTVQKGVVSSAVSETPTAPYVIYVGRASYDKGAIHAAQATNKLRAEGKEISLVLVGQLTDEFQAYFDKLSPSEQAAIQHLGICSDSEKHVLLDGAEMLLLPSRTDSFGLVLLEAWTHSIPVIGARAGGIPDVIDEGQNGLLVDFGDVDGLAQAIWSLEEDETMRNSMGRMGRQKVETLFTWEKVGDRVLQNYEMLLTEPHV